MRLLLRLLTLRVSSKITLPYLVLALCLAVSMAFVAIRLTVGALQERLNNRLIDAGQVTSDGLVAVEDLQLSQLRQLIFTKGVADAVVARDVTELTRLLQPYWASANLSTLIVFDTQGEPILGWQRALNSPLDVEPQQFTVNDLSSWWLVQQIIREQSDSAGDKFSTFHDRRLYTAAPVRVQNRLVGGMMVGMPTQVLLDRLQGNSQASVTTLYDDQGRAFATTQVLIGTATVPLVPDPALKALSEEMQTVDAFHIQDIVVLNGRDYQFAYSPLQLRRSINGFFSVAFSRDFILDAWAQQALQLVGLAVLMFGAVVGVGLAVARHITRPLNDLVMTARAVMVGDLQRRSPVTSRDELGVLARSFNRMTERLLHLYDTSRALNTHHRIVSILDQVGAAIQPLVHEADVLVVLEDRKGWRMYVSSEQPNSFGALHGTYVADHAHLMSLIAQAVHPVVTEVNASLLPFAEPLPAYAEMCSIALHVQGKITGLLIVLHKQRGQFAESVRAPLVSIATMAATSFHNTRLYLEMQDEGNRRRVILESIADGVLVCDEQHNVVLMNPAAETLLNIHDWAVHQYTLPDLPLKPLADTPLLATGASGSDRYEAHGQILRASTAPLTDIEHMFSGEVIVLHNISAEVALDRAKSDLIAVISHELRTPLTSIKGAIDMLAQGIGGELMPLQLELANTAQRQCTAMSGLIEKAVLITNIELGKVTLDLQATKLSGVVEAVLQALRPNADAAGVTLENVLPMDLPPVLADARMLKIAIQEVVDNAVKYGGSGSVHVFGHQEDDCVVLSVQDDGPGIPGDVLTTLFRPLNRGEDSYSHASRGIGLGLTITRELIERHGGTLSVTSEAGRGCFFRFILPIAHQVSTAHDVQYSVIA